MVPLLWLRMLQGNHKKELFRGLWVDSGLYRQDVPDLEENCGAKGEIGGFGGLPGTPKLLVPRAIWSSRVIRVILNRVWGLGFGVSGSGFTGVTGV